MVAFIYRPEYYKIETFEDGTPSEGLADIMIEKNRHGANANIRVRFEKQYTKFSDKDEGYSFDTPASEGITNNESFETYGSKMNDDNEDSAINDDMPY